MANVGKVKLSRDHDNTDQVVLTVEETDALIDLLSSAVSQSKELEDDKYEGQVTIKWNDKRLNVMSGRAKRAKEESDT
jgi:hypothetical protein